MSHSHPWYNLVVGGVDKPLAVSVGENLCSNPRFVSDISGWITGVQSEITRVTNQYAYGEYCGQLKYKDSGLFSADYKIPASVGTVSNRYVVAFRVWNDTLDGHNILIKVSNGVGGTYHQETSYNIVTNKKPIRCAFVTNIMDLFTSHFTLSIFGTKEMSASAVNVLFDDVYICKVEDYCLLPYPNSTHITMEKSVQGENILWDGKIQEFNKKWRPYWYGANQYYSKSDEIKRTILSNASQVFIQPHIDFLWGFFCVWDKDYEQKYSFDRYFGHDSEIALKGTEWLYEGVPKDVEYIPAPTLVTITISSLGVTSGVHIYIDNPDYNDDADGVTTFSRMYPEDTVVRLIAPLTLTVNGQIRNFIQWQDGDANVLSTNRDITITIASSDTKYVARYETEAEVPGYGSYYGETDTYGYGVVL